MFIRVKNTLADNSPLSYLRESIQSGVSNLPVKNINDFTSSYYTQLGKTGEERSEIVLVTGNPANGTIPSGTTTYPHPTDTPVYSIKYNQVIIKRSTSGTSGTATNFGTVDITPDQQFTQFEDSSAQPGYAYKTAFYNSQLDVYSGDSNWIEVGGYSPYSRAGIRDAIRRRIKNIPGVEDDDINLFINEYMELLRSAAVQVNEDYGLGTINVPIGPGTAEYDITEDRYRTPVRVWVINEAGTVQYFPLFTSDVDPNLDYSWDPRFYLPGDKKIGLLPTPPLPGTAQLICNMIDERLDSDDQQVPQPMKPYISGFIDYATSIIYRQDGKDQLAASKEALSLQKVELFKNEVNPRQRMTNEQVTSVMDTTFYNDFSSWGC